jgi:UDP-N-acetylglucosamine 1-carboxyvinyltransferase
MQLLTLEKNGQVNSDVFISGAKNSVLPLICSSVLFENTRLTNVPDLSDVEKLLSILTDDLSMAYELGDSLEISSNSIGENVTLQSQANSEIRYSTLLMGALLGRGCQNITIPKSGGCSSFGDRPIDIHLNGFKNLGFSIVDSDTHTVISGGISNKPVLVNLRFPSVGATINLIFASLQTQHRVTLNNVAIEPEIIDLIEYLNNRGSRITLTDRVLTITKSSEKIKDITHQVIYDRIEALSYVVLATLTKSKKLVKNIPYIYMEQPLSFLRTLGVQFELVNKGDAVTDMKIVNFDPVKKEHQLEVGVYPAIGTDYQPIIAPLMLFTGGTIHDHIYPLRFKYLEELEQLGGVVEITFGKAIISPTNIERRDKISMKSYDLRSGFFNIIIGTIFSGTTDIYNSNQIFRGYEKLAVKLNTFGVELNM